MTKAEYAEYESAVQDFMVREGLQNLSTEGNVAPYFSWSPCDCCGRPAGLSSRARADYRGRAGGDRYDCNGYNPTTEKVQNGYAVCPDCMYYAEYGQLDDTTMMGLVVKRAEATT